MITALDWEIPGDRTFLKSSNQSIRLGQRVMLRWMPRQIPSLRVIGPVRFYALLCSCMVTTHGIQSSAVQLARMAKVPDVPIKMGSKCIMTMLEMNIPEMGENAFTGC